MTSAQSTLGEWLDAELGSVEQGLAVRVRAALPAGWRDIPFRDAPATFSAAAVSELSLLLERGCETRWSAPALLTVDALITFGCESLAVGDGDVMSETLRMWTMITDTLPSPDHAA